MMSEETSRWWNTVTSLIWNQASNSDEVIADNMEKRVDASQQPKKNNSMLYNLVNNKQEVAENEDKKIDAENNRGNVKNDSTLFRILSSQTEIIESENDYHEIMQNINYETENMLNVAENLVYFIEEEKETDELKKTEEPVKLETSEIVLKSARPSSDVLVATLKITGNKLRPNSSPEVLLQKDGVPAISFSFFEGQNKLGDTSYLPMNDKAKKDENEYSSPKSCVEEEREGSPSPSYVGPDNENPDELFYAACEIINNRPPTPFERRKEPDYEDLDVEDQELPPIPDPPAETKTTPAKKHQDVKPSVEEYTDVDANDYCAHREQQHTNLKKLTLLRSRKTKSGLVRFKLTKAWKSVKGWMNEEKTKLEKLEERMEDAKERMEDKLEDAKELIEDVIHRSVNGTLEWKRRSRESLYRKHKSQIYETNENNARVLAAEDKVEVKRQEPEITDVNLPSSPDSLKLNGGEFDFSYFNYDLSKILTSGDCSVRSDSDAYVEMSVKGECLQDTNSDYGSFTVRSRRRESRDSAVSRTSMRKSRYFHEGQSGFEDLRKYIKQGGDFCKELSAILQERAEAEAQYAKSLSKLSLKLLKSSKDAVGSVAEAWQRVGAEMETQSEVHKSFSTSLSDEVVKPLKQLIDNQHRIRKSVEVVVDKTGKSLSEWRQAEMKSKKQSFLCSRENEKLQDAMLDVRNNRNSSTLHLHHNHHKNLSDKESAKLDVKRKKAEESVKKADVEYYSFCVRAERSRLDWETAVTRGSQCFQALEEERLAFLKNLASCYLKHYKEIGPRIVQCAERLTEPITTCDVTRDIQTVVTIKGNGQPPQEQLLPDFYAEHVTLAMNRDRRRQALVKLLQLIRQDLEREKRGKQGVENLQRALQQTPNFGAEESQQSVEEKLHHMKSMLIYLEAARYKVQCALSELDGRGRISHPLAQHIQVTRDRQGLQQSILKVPQWVRNEGLTVQQPDSPDWNDREAGDGTSVQPDSDFDEFSSVGSDRDYQSSVYNVITECSDVNNEQQTVGQCRALYEYSAKLYDELNLQTGDVITIHDKQPDGWWLGELHGVVGIFPATYVEEIK